MSHVFSSLHSAFLNYISKPVTMRHLTKIWLEEKWRNGIFFLEFGFTSLL